MTKHRRQIFFFLLGELMDRITELEFLFRVLFFFLSRQTGTGNDQSLIGE